MKKEVRIIFVLILIILFSLVLISASKECKECKKVCKLITTPSSPPSSSTGPYGTTSKTSLYSIGLFDFLFVQIKPYLQEKTPSDNPYGNPNYPSTGLLEIPYPCPPESCCDVQNKEKTPFPDYLTWVDQRIKNKQEPTTPVEYQKQKDEYETPEVVRLPPIGNPQTPLQEFKPKDCPICPDSGFDINTLKIKPEIDAEFKTKFEISDALQKQILANLENEAAYLLNQFSQENLPVEILINKINPPTKDYVTETFVTESGRKKLVITIGTSNSENIGSLFKNTMEKTLLQENGFNPDMVYCPDMKDIMKRTNLICKDGKVINSDNVNNFLDTLKDKEKREDYVIENLFDLIINNNMDPFKAFQDNAMIKSAIDERFKGMNIGECDKEKVYRDTLKHLLEIKDKKDLYILKEDGKKILTQEGKNLIYEALKEGLNINGGSNDDFRLKAIIDTVPIPYLQKGGCVFYFDYKY